MKKVKPFISILFFVALGVVFGLFLIHAIDSEMIPKMIYGVLDSKVCLFAWTFVQVLSAFAYLYMPVLSFATYSGVVYALAFIAIQKTASAIMLMLSALFFMIRGIRTFIGKVELMVDMVLWIMTTCANIYAMIYAFGFFDNGDGGTYFCITRWLFPALFSYFVGQKLRKYRENNCTYMKTFYPFIEFFVLHDGENYSLAKCSRITRAIMLVLAIVLLVVPLFPYRRELIMGFTSFAVDGIQSIIAFAVNVVVDIIAGIIIIRMLLSWVRNMLF